MECDELFWLSLEYFVDLHWLQVLLYWMLNPKFMYDLSPKSLEIWSKTKFKNDVRVYTGKQACKSKPPRDGDPHTKKVGEKEFNWYPKHEALVEHKPEDCKFDPNFKKNSFHFEYTATWNSNTSCHM